MRRSANPTPVMPKNRSIKVGRIRAGEGTGRACAAMRGAVGWAVGGVAGVGRVTRSSRCRALERDYVRTARAKGLPERTVWLRHALPNAMLPTTTVIAATALTTTLNEV